MLAMYQSRDGGERGSSPAAENVGPDREKGAKAVGSRNHRRLKTNEWGPQAAGDKEDTCASPPPRPGRRRAVDTQITSIVRARWSGELNGAPRIAACVYTGEQAICVAMIPPAMAWRRRLSRDHVSG
jgi:hypothetical protein